jgi:hypothetical protein
MSEQRLNFYGKALDDKLTIAESGIQKNHMLDVPIF